MTRDDDKKPPKPDPFAPLPLPESLTGKTRKSESTQPPPAAPLPPTAFSSRVTSDHEEPVAPFDASAYAPEPAPDAEQAASPRDPAERAKYPRPFSEPVVDEPAYDEAAQSSNEATAQSYDEAAAPSYTEAAQSYTDSAQSYDEATAQNDADAHARVDAPPPIDQLGATRAPIDTPSDTIVAKPASASVTIDSLVPSSYDVNELRDAVGATPIPDDKKAKKPKKKRASTDDDLDDEDRPPRRLWLVALVLALFGGGSIAAMALLGRSNAERFVLACEADRVVIEQGRSFPPWGEAALEGVEWKPMKIPPESPCAPFETKDKAELAKRFEKILEERAIKLVGGRGGSSTPTTAVGPEDPVAKVDEAEANLKQALLVSRWLASDDERITKREELERLLGDVTYWRASARLRAAADALTDAAKQFDAAAIQKPRTNTDPQEWATLARRLAEELRAGPRGAGPMPYVPMPSETTTTSTAPAGVALPIEPAGSASEPTPPPVDAGPAPTGGVLL